MAGRPSCSACNGKGFIGSSQKCVRCGDVVEQCRDWLLLKCIPQPHGQGRDNSAFVAACTIVGGFNFHGSQAEMLFREWNVNLPPPLNESEMAHKLRCAEKVTGSDKPPGYLIWNRESSHWKESSAMEAAAAKKRMDARQKNGEYQGAAGGL